MLALTRKPGEWINIGYFMYIQVVEYKYEGKHENKLKVRIVFDEGISQSEESTKYLTGNLLSIGYGIKLSFVPGNGDQYKIGIEAPSDYLILRMDENGYGEDVTYELDDKDELKNRYSDELSWFYKT
jgi:sRNA-binding carbon storage regulator CsrA